LRVESAGCPDQALPGVVGDECCSLVQRARSVAVAVRLDLLGSLRGDGEQLRDGRHESAGRVGVLRQHAQDRGELHRVDDAGEVVPDLLEGQGGDADVPDA